MLLRRNTKPRQLSLRHMLITHRCTDYWTDKALRIAWPSIDLQFPTAVDFKRRRWPVCTSAHSQLKQPRLKQPHRNNWAPDFGPAISTCQSNCCLSNLSLLAILHNFEVCANAKNQKLHADISCMQALMLRSLCQTKEKFTLWCLENSQRSVPNAIANKARGSTNSPQKNLLLDFKP